MKCESPALTPRIQLPVRPEGCVAEPEGYVAGDAQREFTAWSAQTIRRHAPRLALFISQDTVCGKRVGSVLA